MSSMEEAGVTMVALLEDSYSVDDLCQVRQDALRRRAKYTRPAYIDYIARDKLKRAFRFELGTRGEIRRAACQLLRDLQNIAGFLLNIHQGNRSWLYYTLTA